jgi:uncharacterized protein (DUF2126 family)
MARAKVASKKRMHGRPVRVAGGADPVYVVRVDQDRSSRWMTAIGKPTHRETAVFDDDPDSDKYGFDMPV